MDIPRIDLRRLEGATEPVEPEDFRVESDQCIWSFMLDPPTSVASLVAAREFLIEAQTYNARRRQEMIPQGLQILREGITSLAPTNSDPGRVAHSTLHRDPPQVVSKIIELAQIEPFVEPNQGFWALYLAVRSNTQVLLPIITYGWRMPRQYTARLFEISPIDDQLYIGDGRMVSHAANVANVPGMLEACLKDLIRTQEETPRL
ncbi:MAG TPA: hypothetical protein VFI74_04200 [Candidatus Saccharimonadales bacterium]|nr:hypothetical protein [Candidatus Saccharimonadales bacterium]